MTEFLVAMVLFSAVMIGIFNFLANQTTNAAVIKDYDFFMFYTQKWLNEKSGVIPVSEEYTTLERGDITFTKSGNVLTVKMKDNEDKSMQFTISN